MNDVYIDEDGDIIRYIHIYPLNDLIEHDLESRCCACNPTIYEDAKMVIHSAMDRREVFEKISGA